MKIIIVGGGIGGLSTAIGLSQKGFSVQVLEKAPELTEIGAGIQIGCNGTWVLKAFGLEEAISRVCVAPAAWDFRDLYTGQLLYSAPINEPDGTPHWGSRLYNIHRADLIDILADALPEGTVRLNAECTGFAQDSNGVEVYLKNGEKAYLELANLYNYDIINCTNKEEIRTVEDINEELYHKVKKLIRG